jgi:hypothetical protein
MNERSNTMSSNQPLSKEFRARLVYILKKGSMDETDRKTIELYMRVYFDGYQTPRWHLLEADEMEALEKYRQSRTTT